MSGHGKARLAAGSLLGWEHVNLTGDYIWASADQLAENRDGFRPLRPAPVRSVCLIAVLDCADQLQAASPQLCEQPPKPSSR